MTDVFDAHAATVASRLGTRAKLIGDTFAMELDPRPEVLRHGVVRASVLAFMVDAVAGIVVDTDPGTWTLTSDMSVRMRPRLAPDHIEAVGAILRQGRRSVTSVVELTSGAEDVATGAIGFVRVARRPGDPPKPRLTTDSSLSLFRSDVFLSQPLREEAGVEVVDPAAGTVQMEVTAELRNPAGTLQGAMVALLAEAAAEDLVSTRFESPAVVTDLDIRYLAQARSGVVRTRSRLLGTEPEAPVQVELVDTALDRVTTLVYARAVTAPS